MKPFIRRIRLSEKMTLESFCHSNNIEELPFEHHTKWLNRVLLEFESGDTRVVIGAFFPTLNTLGKVTNYELIGCVFLKRSYLDDAIELKSLVTAKAEYLQKDKFDLNGDLKTILKEVKTMLIEKAIRYCEIREFPKIEMEVLQDEMKPEITLLLDLGFKVSYLREKYGHGRFIYVLEKHIGELYQADPFNEIKIARWFIQKVFPCTIHQDETFINKNFEITKISFNRDPIRQFDLNGIEEGKFQLKGELFIIKSPKDEEFDIKLVYNYLNKESQIRFIISDDLTQTIKNDFLERNMHVITSDLLRKLAGGNKSSLNIPFISEDVAGAITVLENEVIYEYCKHENYAYYLLSGIGSALDLSEDDGLLLAIYCPHWLGDQDGVIVGYSEIVELTKVPFDKAYASFPDIPQALTEKDLQFYKKFSNDKDEVVVVKCGKIKLFKKVISLHDFEVEFETLYLSNQLINNLSSSVYLDKRSCDFFRNQEVYFFEDKGKHLAYKENSRNNFFIMYSIDNEEHNDFVEKIAVQLRLKGKKVTHDFSSLKLGDDIEESLLQEISNSEVLIFIITSSFIKKIKNPGHGLFIEWEHLKNLLKNNPKGKKLMPILMDKNISMPIQLKNIKSYHFSKGSTVEKLVDYLCDNKNS